MVIDEKLNLLALYVVAREQGLPIPTDLQIELVNAGIRREHLEQAASMDDRISFIRGVMATPREDIERMDIPEDDKKFIYSIIDLLTPEQLEAIKEDDE